MRDTTKKLPLKVGEADLDFRITKLDAFSGAKLLKVLSKAEKLPEIDLLRIEKNEADNTAPRRNSTPFRVITPSLLLFKEIINTPATEHTIQKNLLSVRCSRKIRAESNAVTTGITEIISPENDDVVYLIPFVSAKKYMTGSQRPIRTKRRMGLPLSCILPM